MVSLFAGGLAEERERIKARLHALEKQKAFLDKGGTPPSAASSSTTSRGSAAGNARIQNVGKYQSCMVSKLPWWQILGVLAGVLGLSEAGRVQLGLVSNWEQFHRPQALLVSFSPIPLPTDGAQLIYYCASSSSSSSSSQAAARAAATQKCSTSAVVGVSSLSVLHHSENDSGSSSPNAAAAAGARAGAQH